MVGGFGPGERPWVFVPGVDPLPNVGFESFAAGVDAARDEFVRDQAEEAFDLVDSG
ncbi:MAG: hypothetical protein ABI382_13475 [Nakamurella sp.]